MKEMRLFLQRTAPLKKTTRGSSEVKMSNTIISHDFRERGSDWAKINEQNRSDTTVPRASGKMYIY